jgi:spore maturation protein CgeB
MACSLLYLGVDSPASGSRLRADALRRLGYEVKVLDPGDLVGPLEGWQSFLHYRTGYLFLQRRLLQGLKAKIFELNKSPDIIWVNGGELLGAGILKWLRLRFACKIILYQNDDPTGYRDGNHFLSLRAALPFYDLCVFVRPETALEALAMGVRRSLRVYMGYDDVLHAPNRRGPWQTSEPPEPLVSFIGTLIPGESRDQFLVALMKAGIPLRLIGGRWERSSLWPVLQSIYQGPARTGMAYSQALGNAAVSLGFLSHQNRDLVTSRSFETIACGGLLCAERTSEHQLFYEDGWEALFWDSVEECIFQCNKLLSDSELRHKICKNGAQHLQEMFIGNEGKCRYILASL